MSNPAQDFEPPDAFSLSMNALPLLVVLVGLALAVLLSTGLIAGVLLFAAYLYLVPPLACRLLIAAYGRPEGRFTQDTTGYRVWWVATQLQMPFNRLPFLEEFLRLAPGLYPLWMKLWGANFSSIAYAAPGVAITDRWLVEIGPGVVLGAQSAISSHMGIRDEAGRWLVDIAMPVVEEHAILGGQSSMGPGARVRRGALLPAGRMIAPHSTFPKDSVSSEREAA